MKKPKSSHNNIISNIDLAKNLVETSRNIKNVVTVTGCDTGCSVFKDKDSLYDGKFLFNKDGKTNIFTFEERIGEKTKEGNFLGTLLAYQKYKEQAFKNKIVYEDSVILMGMLFGRGERVSPITQAKGCCKPKIEVSAHIFETNGKKRSVTAIEEALYYFSPMAKYLENNGFGGILNKWGDETEIASVSLDILEEDNISMKEYDLIKFISIMEVTEEDALQRDWVIFDEESNLKGQESRNTKEKLINILKNKGIKQKVSGNWSAGISMGPVAVSYRFLDIACEVFQEEIIKDGVCIDFDPYLIMALAMKDINEWENKVAGDAQLAEFINKVPNLFEKTQEIKKIFKKKYSREINLKVMDMGDNVYWADIGRHMSMREKFMSLIQEDEKGDIARRIIGAGVSKDKNGNIIIDSTISKECKIKNSMIIGSEIKGKSILTNSVIIDSTFEQIEGISSFAVRSYRLGKTVLLEHSGLYESLGEGMLILEKKMRHVSVLSSFGKVDMMVSEKTDLRDKKNNYDSCILGNKYSFDEIYKEMMGVGKSELERRRAEVISGLEEKKQKIEEPKQLRFGTSGLRDEVKYMTDMECYINAKGFISFLKEKGEINKIGKIAIGGDRRSSTPRIMKAVIKAITDSGYESVYCGLVPSPTLASYAIDEGIPSIMVTGSHIPDDRNGIKFTKKTGEVLKSDEEDILRNIAEIRKEIDALPKEEYIFDNKGMFSEQQTLPELSMEDKISESYIKRYTDVFSSNTFKGKKIVVYQHSAVGRDIVSKIFAMLGAEVITAGRSDTFVPVDTEKVSDETRDKLKDWAEEYKPFAIISTDGDSDRPLFTDEKGEFLPGDKLGALVSIFLKPDYAAVPISANDAVVKALIGNNIEVKQTKIGSPYVIKAMNDVLKNKRDAKIVSWESNGGFLLGNDWDIFGKKLKALPTRDAVLPIISVLCLAIRENKSVSELIKSSLPQRQTHADVVDNATPGCERYTTEIGKEIITKFSPKNSEILSVNFSKDDIAGKVSEVSSRHCEGAKVTAAISSDDKENLLEIKQNLKKYFTPEMGFGEIININFIDGIRIEFSGGDVAHMRPSGNAPEFRMYATSNTEERAEEIVNYRNKIVPRIVADMARREPKSVGACSSCDNNISDSLIEKIKKGHPIYIMPYEEPKVWGINGIGEYWYGAERGGKTSIGIIDEDEVKMDCLIDKEAEIILGKRIIAKFGKLLPLVKILTPRGRLSVQFHDMKNELWIITGIDKEACKGEPSILLGFSKETVHKYGEKVTEEYALALKEYGVELNNLIDAMEKAGQKGNMTEIGNVKEAAEKVKDEKIQKNLENFKKVEKKLDLFYNYRIVSLGDVVPVSSGTLHALGSGIEIVEPQIAGPTQSLEDGDTYPVRYFFPGYERVGAEKKLDIDRACEMDPTVAPEEKPEVIKDENDIIIEKLPGGFEDKGLEVNRIKINKGKVLGINKVTSFHNLVLVKGEATIIVNGKEYSIPKAKAGDRMLMIPASCEKYEIKAISEAEIIDTFTPLV